MHVIEPVFQGYASDPAAPTAAYVAEKMALPGNPYQSVLTLARKDLFRAFLCEHGFNVPQSQSFQDSEGARAWLDEIGLPVFVKPVDSSGSKGVTKLVDASQFEQAFDHALTYSREKRVVIEKQIVRTRYQVAGDGFIVDGKLVFRCWADEHFDKLCNGLVPIGQTFPTSHPQEWLEVAHAETQRLLSLLGMKTGALNFDFVFTEDGKFYFLELGPRNGGCLIPEVIRYFEFELPQVFAEKYSCAIKYQSARAAFLSLLQQMPHIKRIFMPYFICDSMLAPVHAAGKKLVFYSIDEGFSIENPISLTSNDLLLYVNYFGVCDSNVKKLLELHDPEQVVIDCSQSFFSAPFECLATIYSPRKFFGVPDGGLLVTRKPISSPTEVDESSIKRCAHLLERLAFSAEYGYESYKKSEDSLSELLPKSMSHLTSRLLSAIDYDYVEKKRANNFDYLKNELKKNNNLEIEKLSVAPLCYPYLSENPKIKKILISKRIFIPTYWPEVKTRVKESSVEHMFIDNLLAIPCDQRSGESDLSVIVNLLKGV